MIKLFCLFILLALSIYSQDDELDKLPFDDEPIQEFNKNYFAIGGGYTIGLSTLNIDEINSLIKNQFGRSEFDENLIMHGGAAFTGIPFIKNFRVGFHSYAGNLMNEQSSGEYLTSEQLKVSLSGINFDYGYIVMKNLAILGGVGLGWGNVNLDIAKGLQGYDWDEIQNLPDSNNFYIFTEKKFMYFTPTISVEWAATSFLMFRALAKYNLTFDNPLASEEDKSWQINKVGTISNTPENLSTNGFYFEFGVFFGLFNY